jgi:hypothetical protein
MPDVIFICALLVSGGGLERVAGSKNETKTAG